MDCPLAYSQVTYSQLAGTIPAVPDSHYYPRAGRNGNTR